MTAAHGTLITDWNMGRCQYRTMKADHCTACALFLRQQRSTVMNHQGSPTAPSNRHLHPFYLSTIAHDLLRPRAASFAHWDSAHLELFDPHLLPDEKLTLSRPSSAPDHRRVNLSSTRRPFCCATGGGLPFDNRRNPRLDDAPARTFYIIADREPARARRRRPEPASAEGRYGSSAEVEAGPPARQSPPTLSDFRALAASAA